MGGLTLFNHYVRDPSGNYIKVSVEEPPVTYIPTPHAPPKQAQPQPEPEQKAPQKEAPPVHHRGTPQPPRRPPETQFANKMLGHLNLGDIDSGDLLLLALLFFLFRQKADEELLIAIGLLLIL